MRRRTLLLLPLLPALLAGCGGEGDDGGGVGCAAVYAILPVAGFAGPYTATFTPEGASASTRTYDLAVAADGTVSGSSRDGDAILVLAATSRAGNLVNGCDRSHMVFALNGDPSVVAGETLNATRDRRGTLVGSYSATLSSEAAQAKGTFVVSAAVEG